MKESTIKNIKLLCYVGIFLCALFIILPPFLNFLLPDTDRYTNETKLQTLSCESTREDGSQKQILTHYKNDKVQKIEITYSNMTENTVIDEDAFYNVSGLTKTESDQTLSIVIVPNTTNRDLLSSFLKSIQEQMSIYADGDYHYICEILE